VEAKPDWTVLVSPAVVSALNAAAAALDQMRAAGEATTTAAGPTAVTETLAALKQTMRTAAAAPASVSSSSVSPPSDTPAPSFEAAAAFVKSAVQSLSGVGPSELGAWKGAKDIFEVVAFACASATTLPSARRTPGAASAVLSPADAVRILTATASRSESAALSWVVPHALSVTLAASNDKEALFCTLRALAAASRRAGLGPVSSRATGPASRPLSKHEATVWNKVQGLALGKSSLRRLTERFIQAHGSASNQDAVAMFSLLAHSKPAEVKAAADKGSAAAASNGPRGNNAAAASQSYSQSQRCLETFEMQRHSKALRRTLAEPETLLPQFTAALTAVLNANDRTVSPIDTRDLVDMVFSCDDSLAFSNPHSAASPGSSANADAIADLLLAVARYLGGSASFDGPSLDALAKLSHRLVPLVDKKHATGPLSNSTPETVEAPASPSAGPASYDRQMHTQRTLAAFASEAYIRLSSADPVPRSHVVSSSILLSNAYRLGGRSPPLACAIEQRIVQDLNSLRAEELRDAATYDRVGRTLLGLSSARGGPYAAFGRFAELLVAHSATALPDLSVDSCSRLIRTSRMVGIGHEALLADLGRRSVQLMESAAADAAASPSGVTLAARSAAAKSLCSWIVTAASLARGSDIEPILVRATELLAPVLRESTAASPAANRPLTVSYIDAASLIGAYDFFQVQEQNKMGSASLSLPEEYVAYCLGLFRDRKVSASTTSGDGAQRAGRDTKDSSASLARFNQSLMLAAERASQSLSWGKPVFDHVTERGRAIRIAWPDRKVFLVPNLRAQNVPLPAAEQLKVLNGISGNSTGVNPSFVDMDDLRTTWALTSTVWNDASLVNKALLDAEGWTAAVVPYEPLLAKGPLSDEQLVSTLASLAESSLTQAPTGSSPSEALLEKRTYADLVASMVATPPQ
jgi:hypothetical protein